MSDAPDALAGWVCPLCKQGADLCVCSEEAIVAASARATAGEDELVDASNPAQVADRGKRAKRIEQQGRDDLNWLMRHQQGRRIMWGLLESCGVFANAAVMGAFESNKTMFKAGEQNVGLFYTAKVISQEPEGYNLMVKENSGRLTNA
jgi:hypothetical protein